MEYLRFLNDLCCDVHLAHGAITPKLWALANGRALVAEPNSRDGAETGLHERATLMVMMCSVIEASAVAFTAEAWVRNARPDQPLPAPGQLASLADSDPTIHTAIVTHGRTFTGETRAVIAIAGLDHDGAPIWNVTDEAAVRSVADDDPLEPVANAAAVMPAGVEIEQVDRYADEIGWIVSEVVW